MDLDPYEPTLNKIDEEQKEYDLLQKQCEKLNNYLRVLKILTNPALAQNKLFQIRVKLFDCTFTIHNTFPDSVTTHELEYLARHDSASCFYYIEVFISRVFQEKLVTQNWIIVVSVGDASGARVNRSVNVKNRVSNPITIVVPFSGCTDNTFVEAYLVCPENENFWPHMKLAFVPIDVSYKFKAPAEFKTLSTIESDIRNINQIYNDNSLACTTPKLLKYGFRCSWPKQKFVEAIIKNCYHSPNVAKIINDANNIITATLNIDGIQAVIQLNSDLGKLSLEAAAHDLNNVKNYLRKYGVKYIKSDFQYSQNATILHDLKVNADSKSVATLSNVYEKYTSFVSDYPL